MNKKTRVLISAFACDPVTGSEPYVGWNWANMLAEDVELHVLTRTYSRVLIGKHPLTNKVHFHYFDLPLATNKNHYWRWIKFYYVIWQLLALFYIWPIHRRTPFEIVHHVTYNNIDVSGFLWLLPGTRFVWGPVGGGQIPPILLKEVFGTEWRKQSMRALMKKFARFNPLLRLSMRKSSLVLFANEETHDLVDDFCRRSEIMLETAIEPRPILEDNQVKETVQFLWLGNAIPRKALGLAVDAFARASIVSGNAFKSKLIIIGDGECLPAAKEMAENLGISSYVSFLGRISHSEVDAHMQNSDVFIFTSVQDTSGNVVLEAMANGKPVIALRHQGVKSMVTMGGGILVDIASYQETVESIAKAMITLATSQHERIRMGMLARLEVEKRHTWTAKKHRVLELYDEIM